MWRQIAAFVFAGILPVASGAGEPSRTLGEVPKLCSKVASLPKTNEIVMAQSGQSWPSYQVAVRGVHYKIGVEGQRVRYVATSDNAFRTAEGVSLESSLADVQVAASANGKAEPGWAYIVPLRSGWNAAFESMEPAAGDRVSFLFKRCVGYGKCSCS
jgi:hypothetical protein